MSSLALFTPTKPGTYTFYCSLHYDKATGEGMQGTLIVAPQKGSLPLDC